MISVEGLCFAREGGDFTLSLSFQRSRPAVTAIIGESGSGKTSLLESLAGLHEITEGRFLFEGKDITRLPAWERPVSLLFQEHNLFAHLDIVSNVELGLDRSLSGKYRDNAVHSLERVGLGDYLKRLPHCLSGGQNRRAGLARCLARAQTFSGCRLLLLDEPLSALNPSLRRDIAELIRGLQRENNLYVLVTTHDCEDARRLADDLLLLRQGSLLLDKPVSVLDTPEKFPALMQWLGRVPCAKTA